MQHAKAKAMEALNSKKTAVDTLQNELEKKLEFIARKSRDELTNEDHIQVLELESQLEIEGLLLRDYGRSYNHEQVSVR